MFEIKHIVKIENEEVVSDYYLIEKYRLNQNRAMAVGTMHGYSEEPKKELISTMSLSYDELLELRKEIGDKIKK